MNPSDEPQGTNLPPAGEPSPGGGSPSGSTPPATRVPPVGPPDAYDDGHPHEPQVETAPPSAPAKTVSTVVRAGGGGKKLPPPPPPKDEDDEDDDSMLRMSFLEHLEELRSRIIKALMGI